MSEFDSPADIPFQLKNEGEKITVVWKPGVPTQSLPGVPNSGQGTISWNIPTPARGCATIADGTSAYAGAIVVVSTKPLTADNQPEDGRIYKCPEPTVNPDLHTGDKLGNALVVGAFYEAEKKANNAPLTINMIVNDVDANTPYYVGVYAVDAQFRYHKSGAYAYSREYGKEDEEDTPGRQVVEIGSGVSLTDSTPTTLCPGGPGSPPPSKTAMFDILVTDTYPKNVTKDQLIHIEVEGNLCCTYDQLLFQIQSQLIAHAINSSEISEHVDPTDWADSTPLINSQGLSTTLIITGGMFCNACVVCDDTGTDPPNTGQYCWSDSILQQFDGEQFNIVDGAYIEPTDPADVDIGDYWFNPTTGELWRDRIPNPLAPNNGWNSINVITSNEDPTALSGCDDFWFDGTQGYVWETTTWCELETIVSTIDPSLAPELDCTLFWFDETNEQLLKWNSKLCVWEPCFAIMWDVPPTELEVGTYWFNDAVSPQELRQWDGSNFSAPIAVTVSEEEPGAPSAGDYWFNPETEELFQRDGTNTTWDDIPVLVWPEDPTNPDSCDKWWKTGSPDQLYLWDSVNNEWDLVQDFFVSATDPFTPPTIATNTLWYNPDTDILAQWDGTKWVAVTFISEPTDPTMPNLGDAWYNPETNEWFVWDIPTAGQWNAINPIDSTIDPKNFPSDGVIWFDTTNEVLYERMDDMWVPLPFVTDCKGNTCGALWFDTDEQILNEWDGTAWVPSDAVPATVKLNEDGHIEFVATAKGSNSVVLIIVPEDIPSTFAQKFGNRCSTVSFSELDQHSFAFYGPDSCNIGIQRLQECSAANGTTASNFLFGPSILPIAKILPQIHGFDGVKGTPSYLEVGVGTDGTSDERKALGDFIRQQLGYPVVEVELTAEQIDNAIRRTLDVFRQKSSLAYKRGFFFLDTIPGIQNYKMTARPNGYNKIVNVMGVYRFTSAFLSTAHGAGVFGQIVLQHLYNMGTYDLTSYHLITQYIEQLEHLFATRVTFHWDEPTRELTIFQAHVRSERMLVEASVERTEQEIMVDRWSKNWIEKWALSEAQLILARIRGKYASLPGAGGGVSLDAAELQTLAEGTQERLLQDLEDFLAQDIEDYGMGTTFVIG